MGRRKSKRAAQLKHAKRRALERYGIELTPEKNAAIVRMIQRGQSDPVEQQSLRVSVHDVTFEDQRLRVVYDNQRKCVVTCLPPDSLAGGREAIWRG